MKGVAIALDVARRGEPGAVGASGADRADASTSQPSAGDVDTLLLPGERGDAIKRRRAVDGIPVPASTWMELAAAAADTNIAMPVATTGTAAPPSLNAQNINAHRRAWWRKCRAWPSRSGLTPTRKKPSTTGLWFSTTPWTA